MGGQKYREPQSLLSFPSVTKVLLLISCFVWLLEKV